MRVRLLRHDAPKGYLASVSAAARLARGKFLLLMNNDAVVAPGCLAALLATFQTHPGAGLVVPRFTNQVRRVTLMISWSAVDNESTFASLLIVRRFDLRSKSCAH